MTRKIFYTPLFLLTALIPLISQNQGTLSGYDGLQWGLQYNEAKDRFRTLAQTTGDKDPMTITGDVENYEIRTRRLNIEYRYLFYVTPAIIEKLNNQTNPDNQNTTDQPNDTPNDSPNAQEVSSRFFLVEQRFPYVPAGDLLNKLTEKYGQNTGGSVSSQGRGYYLWDLDRGYIIQFVDPYDKKPFSRSIYYISKELIEEIKLDYVQYQKTPELETILQIIP